jgi:hypothetical protein
MGVDEISAGGQLLTSTAPQSMPESDQGARCRPSRGQAGDATGSDFSDAASSRRSHPADWNPLQLGYTLLIAGRHYPDLDPAPPESPGEN